MAATSTGLACSSNDGVGAPATAADAGHLPLPDAGAQQATEHGTLYDYGGILAGQMTPVRALTISDGTQTVVADDKGSFSLVQPTGVVLNGSVTGSSRGNPYATLLLPEVILASADADRGDIILPDKQTFDLEETILSNDKSKAVVNVVVVLAGSCASAQGGTITVGAPGAKIRYIDALGYPRVALKAIDALTSQWHAAASVYDVEPGAKLDVRVTHPTCAQVPFPATYKGVTFTGNVVTKPASEEVDSALVVVLGDGPGTASDAGADAENADAGAGAVDSGADSESADASATSDAGTD